MPPSRVARSLTTYLPCNPGREMADQPVASAASVTGKDEKRN